MKKVLLLSLLLVACNYPQLSRTARDVQYVQDERTGLCFAVTDNGESMSSSRVSHVYSHVPCTPEVERLIKK
jgi:hypothetical protein